MCQWLLTINFITGTLSPNTVRMDFFIFGLWPQLRPPSSGPTIEPSFSCFFSTHQKTSKTDQNQSKDKKSIPKNDKEESLVFWSIKTKKNRRKTLISSVTKYAPRHPPSRIHTNKLWIWDIKWKKNNEKKNRIRSTMKI